MPSIALTAVPRAFSALRLLSLEREMAESTLEENTYRHFGKCFEEFRYDHTMPPL